MSCVVIVVVSAAVVAQLPSFDVASIKRSSSADGPTLVRYGGLLNDGRWVATNATFAMIVRAVYPGHDLAEQVVGLPAWAETDRFDIAAKPPAGISRDATGAMAKRLLAERFQLSLHTEMRELPAFRLVLAQADRELGPGMTPAAIDCDAIRREAAGKSADPRCVVMSKNLGGAESLTAGGITIARLAALLGPMIGRQISDGTRLTGQYDVTLTFTPDVIRPGKLEPADGSAAPSLATALREQLGLKLESTRMATEVLVIDRLELPTPD
jgi:uncharacterized protein (TIGR03435 family)